MISSLVAVFVAGAIASPSDSDLAGSGAPDSVTRNLVSIEVSYRGDDGFRHKGRIVCHKAAARDLADLFDTIQRSAFPLRSVQPVSRFENSDSLSMLADNTSAFNWRSVKGTTRLSSHALGLAIDINPLRNPFAHRTGNRPAGAVRDPRVAGTLSDTSLVVRFLRHRGWIWGGRWPSGRDWQHFELPLSAARSRSDQERRSTSRTKL